MSKADSSDMEWISLPRPKERCRITDLSRTSLREILDEIDPATGAPFVEWYRKERHGKQSRLIRINKASLLEYLDKRARAQALRFAPHVNNPKGETVETVIADRDLFGYFIGEDNVISDDDWFDGKLATRASRIRVLRDLGLLVE